jgi:hypothetical protein
LPGDALDMPKFDEEDDEYVELVKEYERFIKDHPGYRADFYDWLDDNYGDSRKRVLKPKRATRRNKET